MLGCDGRRIALGGELDATSSIPGECAVLVKPRPPAKSERAFFLIICADEKFQIVERFVSCHQRVFIGLLWCMCPQPCKIFVAVRTKYFLGRTGEYFLVSFGKIR